jgi:hypothetical protein
MFSILHAAAKFEYGGKSDLAAPDAGVGGFIIEWLFNLLLLCWVLCVAFLLRKGVISN